MAETEVNFVLEKFCRLRLNLQQRHDEILLKYFSKIEMTLRLRQKMILSQTIL